MTAPPRQIPLDLPHGTAVGRADFFVSDSNAAALAWIERWPDWPVRGLVLYGPAGSGKSHLAKLWCERAAAVHTGGAGLLPDTPATVAGNIAVDDAEAAPEPVLLHLYNAVVERGGTVLVAARQPPAAWPIELPDLASRLRALPAAGIAAPDDALLAAVLVKHFADRQVRVAPGLIAYLVPRMERSFAAAAALVARLDRFALSRGGPITVPLARRLLERPDDQSRPSDFAVT